MYANVNFSTKTKFRQAVLAGQHITLYSPLQGYAAVRGVVQAEGPWPGTVGARHWRCRVRVQDMRVVGMV